MNWYKIATEESYAEMVAWFKKRTEMHIGLVQKYCKKIEEYDPEKFEGLVEQAKDHDASKFEDPEVDPYVYITWQYYCKEHNREFKAPEDMDEKMNIATNHHVLHNAHHPEKHCGKKVDVINRSDRDKPKELIDSTKMPDLDIAEMLADWKSVSEEKGTSLKGWADKNVNIRWKFSDKQKDLIYELVEFLS